MKTRKKPNGLSRSEQKMMEDFARWLHEEVEAVILEGFKHTAARPRDPFDALVLIAFLSLTIVFHANNRLDIQDTLATDQRMIIMSIFHISMVMEKRQINVSPVFPFTREAMIGDFGARFDEGELALSQSVAEAMERIKPILTDIANYLTAAYPNGRTLFPLLTANDRPDK